MIKQEKEDIGQVSIKTLLEAREPYDKAISAVTEISKNRDFILDILYKILLQKFPEKDNFISIKNLLLNGSFPNVVLYSSDNSLRINGALTDPDSFWKFIKDTV